MRQVTANENSEQDAEEISRPKFDVPVMSLDDKMKLFEIENDFDRLEEDEIALAGFDEDDLMRPYAKIVFASPEYQWMLHRIRREMDYIVSGADWMAAISKTILDLQPDKRDTIRRQRPESLHIVFSIDWPEQNLDESIRKLKTRDFEENEIVSVDTLQHALVLIGTSNNALATTCGEYLSMIWPVRGMQLLEIIQKAIAIPAQAQTSMNSSFLTYVSIADSTLGSSLKSVDLTAMRRNHKIVIQCTGEINALGEIACILGWLTCALHPPGLDTTNVHLLSPEARIEEVSESKGLAAFPSMAGMKHCSLTVKSQSAKVSPGQCWHAMFENPTITEGYPIPRRDSNGSEHGLELALAVMSLLMRTTQATLRNGCLAIKEFSHALIPICRLEKTIQWHYVFSAEGKNLAYWKVFSEDVFGLKTSDLAHYRHFIGWCLTATSIAG